jgi:uncharacterized membrane protein
LPPVLRGAFAFGAIAWAVWLPLATWIAGRPHPLSLPYAAAAVVYGIGSWICHQRPDRSFYLWATQMPVCGRCTGIYLGGALAAAALIALRPRLQARSRFSSRQWRLAVAMAALPTLATVAVEWTGAAAPANIVRAIAGLPLGAVIVWALLRAEVN